MAYADLHIHSTASDGTLSPEEIVRLCVENGVGALSVTDHDAVEGTLRAAPLARAAGLVYISGVEIDSLWRGRDVHVLCYGADLENGALLTCIREARARMDGMSDALLERMLKDFPALSKEEYAAFERDKTLGGWKMLHYLLFKGVTRSMTDGMRFYGRYGVSYAEAGFRPTAEVTSIIRAAGGKAILAHPGVTLRGEANFPRALEELAEEGADGLECWYPAHSRDVRETCLSLCRRRKLLVSAGSDCHGSFQDTQIGQTKTDMGDVSLELLRLT